MKWLAALLDRLCAVLGAFIFCQFPAFFQQYAQRLGGHFAEVSRQTQEFDRLARQSGKTLHQYIQKFLSNSDPDFARQGEIMQALVQRKHQLSDALMQLNQATPLSRPWAFVSHLQADIAKGTLSDFQPALTLSVEGAIYAFVGLVVGYLAFALIRRLVVAVCHLGTGLGQQARKAV